MLNQDQKNRLSMMNGRELVSLCEGKFKKGEFTRKQCTEVYNYWNTHNKSIQSQMEDLNV